MKYNVSVSENYANVHIVCAFAAIINYNYKLLTEQFYNS